MILRVLDLLCSIPAALVLLCALASLTFLSAGVYGFQSRRVGRIGLQASGRPASAGEDGMVGELCTFVLKGYGFALLLGVLFRDLGGVVAACIGSAVLAMGEQRQDHSLQVLRPADVLDGVFLCATFPCLCAPMHIVHGFGAACLVYLYVAFLWKKSTQAATESFVVAAFLLCASYLVAWLAGLFLPLRDFRAVDALLLGAALAVLKLSPDWRMNAGLVVAALVWAPVPRAFLAAAVAAVWVAE